MAKLCTLLRHEPLQGIWLPGEKQWDSAQWPIYTDKVCFYCAHTFNTQPIPLYRSYDYDTNTYEVFGHVCSASCAKAWILERPSANAAQAVMRQREMLIKCFGWPADKPLPPPKSKYALQMFGGHLSIDEWRASDCGQLLLMNQQFVPHRVVLQTQTHDQPTATAVAASEMDTAIEQLAMPAIVPRMERPPEDQCIKTAADLAKKYPEAIGSNSSVFANFLQTHVLPSEAECAEMRRKLEYDRKTSRKRKHPLDMASLEVAPPPMVQTLAERAEIQVQKRKRLISNLKQQRAPRTKDKPEIEKPEKSPEYVPTSPSYVPHSPTYGPNSPSSLFTTAVIDTVAPPSPDYGPS